MNLIQETFGSLLDLLYPRICAACNADAPVRGGIFCLPCLADLPETNFHTRRDNPFTMHFWGRVPIEVGSAFLFYVPGGKSQNLIHNIKYKRISHYALTVGQHYGSKIAGAAGFSSADVVVPVPLHWKKEQKRGFNQSLVFARGVAESLAKPVVPYGLIRTRETPTQTRKSRSERVSNIKDAFKVKSPEFLKDKHVLLVDDVLTTGATLEACALALLDVPGIRISMATLAMGRI